MLQCGCVRFVLRSLIVFSAVFSNLYCSGQYVNFRNTDIKRISSPLPFPTCRADNVYCLRRGIRSFFFLMDSGYLGMKPIDPTILNSVAISLPEQQLSILFREVNVTGAKWSRLGDRKFNLLNGRSGVTFTSDLHLTGDLSVTMPSRYEPFTTYLTLDIQDVESNITYPWTGEVGADNEDYINIGPERIAVRNTKTPTFFLQSNNKEDSDFIERLLTERSDIVEHLSNEIVTALMHTVTQNFRQFARRIAVKYYYEYY